MHSRQRTPRSLSPTSRSRQLLLIGFGTLLTCLLAVAIIAPFRTNAAPTSAAGTPTPTSTDSSTVTATQAPTTTPTDSASATSTPTTAPTTGATNTPAPTDAPTTAPTTGATNTPAPTSTPSRPAARKLFLPMVSRAPAAPTTPPAPPAPPAPPVGNGGVVFISDARISALRDRVNRKVQPTYNAWTKMLSTCNSELGRQPQAPSTWFVPFYYQNKDGHLRAKQGLQDDSNIAYQEALCYRITGDERYAQTAARLINAWATKVQTLRTDQDSMLSFSYHFPGLIFAADLIKASPNFPSAQQQTFKTFVRNRALPMNTMSRKNNQGNWGLVLYASSAAYLGDRAMLNTAVERYKQFIETQIGSDGRMLEEVERNNNGDRGIYYSHFSLFPQTIAAEILRLNGTDLYNYKSPSGRTLRQAFERIAAWSRNPQSFPIGNYYKTTNPDEYETQIKVALGYFEILNERWPNADAAAVIAPRRPITGIHTAINMTFTHGGLLAP